ncbi:SNF2 family N-terminal domain-containing protein [Chlamydoabsidia padenii]|nr:SNF2 family N-terminal domain-containing protein [Chlamydoabsidia padenii]
MSSLTSSVSLPNGVLAPIMPNDKIKALIQRARLLQAQGASEETHLELANIMQFLRQQQRLQYQQRMAQQEQQTNSLSSGIPSTLPPTTAANQLSSSVDTSSSGTVATSSHLAFTQEQLSALKYQIMAYKLISKNMPLPPILQQAVLSPINNTSTNNNVNTSQQSPSTENDQPSVHSPATPLSVTHPDTNPPVVSTSINPSTSTPNTIPITNTIPLSITPTEPSPSRQDPPSVPQHPVTTPSAPVYNAYASPYNLMKKSISLFNHASRQQRLLVPSITTSGMDPEAISQERERRIHARLTFRQSQLESETESALSNQENDMGSTDVKDKVKLLIELHSLKLLEKQKKLRQELVVGMTKGSVVATSVDRLAYRKMKKLSLREARGLEAIERQQRLDRQQHEKQQQMEHLQSICDHGRALVTAQQTWQAKQTKLGRTVLQFHQHIEKEEQKKAERLSKERIKALKNDDEEAYMKLIDEAKDTRLTQLLRQTGSFLESLSKAVVDQQNDHRVEDTTADSNSLDDTDTDFGTSEVDPDTRIDYFKVTHKVKENVSQPGILVGGTLKDYQIKGLQWMVSLYNNHLNGILADEMGLGKTIQTISLITYLIEKKKQQGPYLIIVPLSTLTNWNLEFDKWAPSVSKIVYKGPPQVRRALQMEIRQGNFQVLLTTFEYIIKDRPLLSKIKWLHMIIDEGHRMKNTKSKLTYTLRTYYNTRYRLILTGTPLQNNLPELWALLNFVLPKIFKSVKSFEEWFNTPFSNQGVQDKIDLNEEEQLLIIKRLHKVLRPFLLRRLKKDVESELPDKVEKVVKCKLSALQSRLYNQLKKFGMLYTSTNEKGKTGIKGLNNTIMQLRKICNHPFVFEGVENTINPTRRSNDMLYRTAGKFELLDRMLPKLRKTGHRVLIFFQMTQIMNIMEDFLNYRGFAYLRLDGSTKADDRSQLLQIFNAPNSPYFVFLLSTRAGGLGLNLQTADTVIIFDSDWNPHQDLQAQDRAHRIGQTKEVRIFRLITANSIEENILAKANYKLDIDGKVIQAGKFDNRSTDEDREAFLRTLLEDKNDENDADDSDVEEGLDDEELNEMLKRSDQELAIFKKIDAERNRTETEMHKRMSGGHSTAKFERLIQDDELPDVYRIEEVAETMGPLVELGRGQRARDEVRYDEGLTEEEWNEALENNGELVSSHHHLNGSTNRRLGNGDYSDDSDSGSRRGRRAMMDGSNKKRGRPKKSEPENKHKKTKRDDCSGPDIIPPHIRHQMTQIFEKCYKAVEESRAEDEHTYRQRSQLFMDLVCKRDYPIYYTMIKKPIAMKIINKRIHSPYYKTIQQFRADFDLMFDNARTFNEEGSLVYEDADEMQKILHAQLDYYCPGGILPPLENHYGGKHPMVYNQKDNYNGGFYHNE